ncbi:MAG: aminopeptidase P family protein, partial [Eggerthellaceae bacterium]|nr:aminopeptidase P family protein [Eggerthellaceae bacterium]
MAIGNTGSLAQARIERLRAKMAEQGLGALYVRDVSNIAWLTAFENVFDSEPAHAAYVDAYRSALHTDSRYITAFKRAAEGGPWVVDDAKGAHAKWLHGMLPEGALLGIEQSMTLGEFRRLERELFGSEESAGANTTGSSSADGIGKGAEDPAASDTTPVAQEGETTSSVDDPGKRTSVKLRETSGFIVNLRAVKDAYEIECLRAAQAVTDAAFAHMVGFMRPGMTEREVQMELEDFMLRNGGSGLAFSSIVATGANGASPHAIPGSTRLEAGQCVVMDFGARARGYCSDMTRMVFLGQPDERMRKAYEVLRDANEQVEAMLRPGVTGAEAHQLAEDLLAAGGFGGKMGHSLGHGVGIDIHEEPVLAPRNNRPLQTGNV